MVSDALVVAVVLVTFGLLFFNQIRVYPLSRSLTSATGAVVVLAIGAISPDEALASVDASTLLLLFGMLAHVEALSLSGFYGWAGSYLVDYTGTARRLTVGTLVLAAVLSTFALNDATVLLLTPILVKVVRNADIDPVPPLIAVVLGANIGSVATPLGNPQNAYILNRSGLTSVEFVAHLAPVALVCLFLAAVVLVPITAAGVPLPEVPVPDIDEEWALSSVAFLLATFVLLILFPEGDPGLIAASMGILHISWLQLFRRVPGEDVLHGMDWSIIVLFVGIFVLVGSLEETSLDERRRWIRHWLAVRRTHVRPVEPHQQRSRRRSAFFGCVRKRRLAGPLGGQHPRRKRDAHRQRGHAHRPPAGRTARR